jgi:ABC-type glycerol-3-phosphate transport system substrate-binding protein
MVQSTTRRGGADRTIRADILTKEEVRMASYRKVRVTAAVAALGLALTGCGALTPGSDGEDKETAPTSVSTELSEDEVTLEVAFTDGPDMVEALVAAFEEKYPQVTVEPQYTQFTDYSKNLKLTMTSDTAPDVAQYNVAMKDLIGAGEVLELDAYSDAYGWTEKFPEISLKQLTSESNGKTFGSGHLYGVPAGLSLTGVFYNKALAEQAGIDGPPATLDEFADDLQAAKDAGLAPLSVGALDSAGLHLWAALLNVMMPQQDYLDWVNGQPGGDLTGADAVAATQTLVDWSDAGYYAPGANGTGQADATANFAQGKSVFLMNGNWAAAQVSDELGDDAGFFLMPGPTADAPATGSGFSVAYSVSSRTDVPDAAAAFLDFLSSDEAAVIESEGGFLPPNIEAAPEQTGVRADLYAAFQRVIEANGLNLYPDFAAPSAYDQEVAGIQGLIAGEGDVDEFLSGIQATRDEYHGQ